MTDERDEGIAAALLGKHRNDNPYARGWSRMSALVMPDSLSALWDEGYMEGRAMVEKLAKVVGEATRKSKQ